MNFQGSPKSSQVSASGEVPHINGFASSAKTSQVSARGLKNGMGPGSPRMADMKNNGKMPKISQVSSSRKDLDDRPEWNDDVKTTSNALDKGKTEISQQKAIRKQSMGAQRQ